MTDKIIAVAAMLDATDGEQDNASRILQRMLASRNSTLIDFISEGLSKINIDYALRQEILNDVQFPFDAERIDRLTEKFKENGLSWRAIARGDISDSYDSEQKNQNNEAFSAGFQTAQIDPYNIQFINGTRKIVDIPAGNKTLHEWPRNELPKRIIALIRPREKNRNELKVSAYTQDSETVIAYGDFIINGQEAIETVLEHAAANRALMFKVIAPKNDKKPMTLKIL